MKDAGCCMPFVLLIGLTPEMAIQNVAFALLINT